MDFLKSCTTNVREIPDFLQTPFICYTLAADGDFEDSHPLVRALREARKANILCSAVEPNEIWLFGSSSSDQIERKFSKPCATLVLKESGEVASKPEEVLADGRLLKHVLLDALERSISFALAHTEHILRLGGWQWVYNPTGEHGCAEGRSAVLISLTPALNTERGTLYIDTELDNCALRALSDGYCDRAHVLLAPSGRPASIVQADSTSLDADYPASVDDPWLHEVRSALSAEGLHVDNNDEWITVAIAGDESSAIHRVTWPKRLCLALTQYRSAAYNINEVIDWRQCFSNESTGYKSPFAEAEDWFRSASAVEPDLEETVAAIASAQGQSTESPLATSPPFNQRLIDHQLAMSGIYPTPPDGVQPSHMQTTQAAGFPDTTEHTQVQTESNSDTNLFGSDDTDHLDAVDERSLRQHSLALEPTFTAYQPDGNDLFGDVDDNMNLEFNLGTGDDAVGDADFDYFDEPGGLGTPARPTPLVPGGPSEHSPEITEGEGSMDVDARESSDVMTLQPLQSASPDGLRIDPDKREEVDKEGAIMTDTAINHVLAKTPETSLTPFSIRERLLPRPIPASTITAQRYPKQERQGTTFVPIAFNEDLSVPAQYAGATYSTASVYRGAKSHTAVSIDLPPKTRKPRSVPRKQVEPDSGVDFVMDGGSSEEDSYDDVSSEDQDKDIEMLENRFAPFTPPLNLSKKRKRDATRDTGPAVATLTGDETAADHAVSGLVTDKDIGAVRGILFGSRGPRDGPDLAGPTRSTISALSPGFSKPRGNTTVQTIEALYNLTKLDLVHVAQIIGEQSSTTTTATLSAMQSVDPHDCDSYLQSLSKDVISHVLDPNRVNDCTPTQLALTKDAAPRMPITATKLPQPRPPHAREGSVQHLTTGPDIFAIQPPYIRVQRGSNVTEHWEMLPPALDFWLPLGLAPAGGTKHVSVICIAPGSLQIISQVQDFILDLGRSYEAARFGKLDMAVGRSLATTDVDLNIKEGVVAVDINSDHSGDIVVALRNYAAVCSQLGKALAEIGTSNPERTIVIALVDPFHDVLPASRQHLSLCFWILYKAYVDNAPKSVRRFPRSDIVLQILPLPLIACPHLMVLLDSQQMAYLAMELYDRCPSLRNAEFGDHSSAAMSPSCSPAIELASQLAKRIAFQLSPDPPSDLLNEGLVLHLAYAMSEDGRWLTTCWTDNTSRLQHKYVASLQGKTFENVATDVWERTQEILSTRTVMWRVFIASPTKGGMDSSMSDCWRSIVSAKPRKQVLHVTLLGMDRDPHTQLRTPAAVVNDPSKTVNAETTPSAGFLTPASTPRDAMLATSPDTGGLNNVVTGLTPGASGGDSLAANNADTDPDAHLVDPTDDCWGMLLAPSYCNARTAAVPSDRSSPLVSGLLLRRGSAGEDDILEALGVDLYWDIRIRPTAVVDEGPTKQTETTLREVLKMYRGLCLLSSARGYEHILHGKSQLVPAHLLGAVRAAEALDGFLD